MLRIVVAALLLLGGNDAQVSSFEVSAKGQLIVVDWKGTCHRSSDAGKTWADSSAIWMRKTMMASETDIWGINAISQDEKIAHSIDGGKTWTSITLDSGAFHPVTFVGVQDKRPLLVDQVSQLRIWQGSGQLDLDGSAWRKVGVENDDHDASSGILVNGTYYVGAKGKIWQSTDLGAHWSAFTTTDVAPFVEFAACGTSCWASTREGHVFRAEVPSNKWVSVASLPSTWFVFGMAATAEGVFVAGREDPPKAILAFVRPDGKVDDCGIPSKWQIVGQVRIDEQKTVWVKSDLGLFHRSGDHWIEVWPAR